MNEHTPAYYQYEKYDVIDEFEKERGAYETIMSCFFNIKKYLKRAGNKTGNSLESDVFKAADYLDRAEDIIFRKFEDGWDTEIFDVFVEYRKAVKEARNNIKKWHNIVDDPEDLPEDEENVLVIIVNEDINEDEPYSYYTGYCINGQWWSYMNHDCHRVGIANKDEYDMHSGDKVIAWIRWEEYK